MATIKDIAAKLGIAVSTVSKGLNGASDISEEMRQLVLDTAVEMGYAQKRVQKLGSHKVCVLVENIEYNSIDQFGYEVIMGFKLSAARRHYEVDVLSTDPGKQNTEKYDTFMLKHGYSGAFLLGFCLQDDYLRQLQNTTVPSVLLDNFIPNRRVGYVGTDNDIGIGRAVELLADQGHTRIALLNGCTNSLVTEERLAAFLHAMERRGLSVEPALLGNGWFVAECAKAHVGRFLEHGATAIVCATDLIASGALMELNRLGRRVPEDVSVIGFDDLPLAQHSEPPLTTIRQDRVALGKSAFMVLEQLIGGVSISKLLLLPELIMRSSTGPVPQIITSEQ